MKERAFKLESFLHSSLRRLAAFCISLSGSRPALVVHGSTARGPAPARAYVFAVLDYAGHGRVAVRIGEHLTAALAVVLRVILYEGHALGIVVIPGLLA